MKTSTHKQEIHDSRTGGFGGSDAALFYKIGSRGLDGLTNTDKKRIRVAKGLDAYQPIPTNAAMQRGHDFEAWYAEQSFAPMAAREGVLNAEIAHNFRTFAHADFLSVDREVWELKCVQSPEAAQDNYFEQLQWYYMLGASAVWLVVCDSKESTFAEGCQMPVFVYKDKDYIETMRNGVQILDEAWNTLDLTLSEDWNVSDLMPFESAEVVALSNYLTSIKQMEAAAEEAKARVLQFMQENNIRSLKSDMYTITYIAESETRTLDKSKLFKAYPEINPADFEKVSKKKPYITVKLK